MEGEQLGQLQFGQSQLGQPAHQLDIPFSLGEEELTPSLSQAGGSTFSGHQHLPVLER